MTAARWTVLIVCPFLAVLILIGSPLYAAVR